MGTLVPSHGPSWLRGPSSSELAPPVPNLKEHPLPRGARASGNCPSLHTSVCLKRGETRDPTGYVRGDIAGELQVLRTLERMVHEHPDWSQEELYAGLSRKVYSPNQRRRLQTAFNWVRRAIESILLVSSGSALSEREKVRLLREIRKVKLDLPPAGGVYSDAPELAAKDTVMLEAPPGLPPRIRVGGAYLATATSWFNLIFSLSHEFGHAIDPCEMAEQKVRIRFYERLSACLVREQIIPKGSEYQCGSKDQLSETFADWLAAQVTRQALEEFATEYDPSQLMQAATNAVRDLCSQDEGLDVLDLTYHPKPEVRIDGIFRSEPGISRLLGCNEQRYCTFDSQ